MPKPNRILIVDDEADLLDLLRFRMEDAGFEVHTAANGQDGLQQARALHPDLIVLDVMMPKLNGFHVCGMLKSDEQTMDIPIIMLSAASEETHVETGKHQGADSYITKPFEPEALAKEIDRLLVRYKKRT